MAEVIVSFKVLPKTVEVDLDSLEKKITESIKPERLNREPIAFGLVAILMVKIVQDAEGEVDRIEKALKAIPEVGEVEVTGLTRAL